MGGAHEISASVCRNLEASRALEWLETNRTGSYALGTVSGMNTRRYHGLLVAALRPPVARHVLLSRLDETVLLDDHRYELAVNQYAESLHPLGHEYLESFEARPLPRWRWHLDSGQVERTLFLVPDRRAVMVRYLATRDCVLKLNPLLAFRDHHGLARSGEPIDGRWAERPAGTTLASLLVQPRAHLPALVLQYEGAARHEQVGWHPPTEYAEERARGYESREDLWCLGTIELPLRAGRPSFFAAHLEGELEPLTHERALALQSERLWSMSPAEPRGPVARLSAAADDFRVRGADGMPAIVAGYPWFTVWGRDALISLPGLLVARGLLTEACDVVRGFLRHLHQGLVPNLFPDGGDPPEHHTVDATLWAFEAAHALEQAGAEAFVRDEFFPQARKIIGWHRQGTLHKIRVDPADGLLAAGDETTALTWMDARIGGKPVTPRFGKPVEVNALWFNALRLTELWAHRYGDVELAETCAQAAETFLRSFRAAFWCGGHLADVVRDGHRDEAFRPNQLLAVSLTHSPLELSDQQVVVRAVQRRLLTPVGLRTLAPDDPQYRGRCEGGPVERDLAYHQGTVWPWLLGPYVDAYLRAFGRSDATLAHCRDVLAGLLSNLDEACLDQLSEIFDGDAPFTPRGACAQAWSVAEMLRLLLTRLAPY